MSVEISDALASQIVESVKEVCGYDVNFISPDGMILMSTDHERIGTFHEIGRRAAISGQVTEVAPGEQFRGTQPGVNIPLFHEGALICVIGITGLPGDVRRFAWLAVRITQLLLREQEQDNFLRTQQEKREYVVRTLTGSAPGNQSYLEECLRQLHITPEPQMCAVLIRVEARVSLANLSMIDKKISDFIEGAGIRLYRFRYPGEYILLCGASCLPRLRRDLSALSRGCSPLLSAGVGPLVPAEKLDSSFRDAELAVAAARRREGRYAEYGELDLEILLSGIGPERGSRFCGRVIQGLSPEDLHLLDVYFSHDSSLGAAAAALPMHKNTLQYRLNRIRDITGYDPRSFRDAVVLYLALCLSRPEISERPH